MRFGLGPPPAWIWCSTSSQTAFTWRSLAALAITNQPHRASTSATSRTSTSRGLLAVGGAGGGDRPLAGLVEGQVGQRHGSFVRRRPYSPRSSMQSTALVGDQARRGVDRRRPGPAGRCSTPRGPGTSRRSHRQPGRGAAGGEPGRTTSTTVASSRTSSTRSQVRQPGGRVAAEDHEQLPGRGPRPAGRRGCRPCRTARRRRARGGWPPGRRRRATAAATMASRSSAGLIARVPTFCQGTLFTTSSTRSRARSWRTLTADGEVADVGRVERAPEDARGARPRCLGRHGCNLFLRADLRSPA